MAIETDWGMLSYAIECYKSLGFRYVEVPWIVPNSVNMITCPSEHLLMKINDGETSLVGSAEQSFLKMEFDGKLPKGKYVGCSPCFRREEADDGLHHPWFIKVELYQTDQTDTAALYEMIHTSERFLNGMILIHGSRSSPQVTRLHTTQGVDLMLNGIEVGSYGIRSCGEFKWVYGTGFAVPRFSQALQV